MTTTSVVSDQTDQFEAARTGNLQWFKQQHAVRQLPDLTKADLHNRHVIEYAAENGHLDVVKYLIEDSGQDINVTTFAVYALEYAATNGHLEIVKYLVEEGDRDADTPLIYTYMLEYATTNGHLDVVKYLIEDSDQDVDATVYNNYAIKHATINGHLDIVKYLIEDCPQPIDLSVLGRELLQIAAESEYVDLVEYLSSICEAIENIDLIVYEKVRTILLKSSSQLSYAEQLQHLAALPDGVLQTLTTSAEGLQQLRAYLQKASNAEACVLATTTRIPRL